jgi:hypothetical protein
MKGVCFIVISIIFYDNCVSGMVASGRWKIIILVLVIKVSLVAQVVWYLATGYTTGRTMFDPRQRRKDFSCSLCVQPGSGAHPASCTMGTGGPFPGAEARSGRDTDHSPPSSADVENE